MVLLILEIDLILGNYYPGLGCLAFLFLGNFNDFLTWEDKSSSNLGNGPSPLFCTFLNKFHLQALHPNGPRLTWTNNSQGNRKTLERLDWAVGNSIWHSQHPNSILNHLDFFGSDHRAIQLSINQNHHSQFSRKKDKRFLFENVWLSEPQWNDVLLEAWSSNTPSNDPSTNLLLKQSTCSTFLSNWKHKAFFGLCKRIENGANTNILDPWIPNHRFIPTQIPTSLVHVSDLLLPNGDWNIPLLQTHFQQDTINDILSLPPPDNSQSDSYFWQHSPSGHYSVKTGYHDYEEGLVSLISQQCWNARNAAVFRNQDSNPVCIEQEAQDYLDFYQAAQDKRMTQPQSTTDLNHLAWEAPPVGTLKLNTDAAVSSHKNKIRGGVLVRDHTGKVIAATAFSRMGQMQPQAAEGWVLWEGLKWSRDNGINIHHIEVDCKNLLTDLQSTDENLSSYGTIINVIRRMLSSLPL
ncbi:hypothetical protein G4B88_030528 [Cannabis sativa]|uniref:RNase H type-1 domain-containing protein n=1 Tax=Cannabis sativa TaxID=3483 RepID=A0A7J6FJL7_CANSA|nr:hypothetical protein G4B88_030528 [Cannabis sativa]